MRINQILGDNAKAEDPESNSKYLQKIREKIVLPNAEMLELIEDQQKFINTIIKYNQMGVESYQAEQYQTGLIWLQEAERILQYAASCGKTIDRFHIITTLHNEAASFQKLFELHKSYDYMQAILFNLKAYFQQNPQVPITQALMSSQSPQYKQQSSYIYRKILTVIYNLQFAAISSQIDKHEIAIASAKKSLSMLGSIIQLIEIWKNSSEICHQVNYSQVREVDLRSLHQYCLGIDKSQVHDLIKVTKNLIKKIREKETQDKSVLKMKKFSIGQIMQMQAITVEESNQYKSLEVISSYPSLCRVSLYVSICYYTIATQLRLIAKKERADVEQTHEHQKSKIFHLFAIKISLIFAPFLSEYHGHITRSFKTNYHIDLFSEVAQNSQQEKIKQNLLQNESFMLKKQAYMTVSQQIKKSALEPELHRNFRPRKLSTQSLLKNEEGKKNHFLSLNNLKIVKKKKKSVSKDRKNTLINTIAQSRETIVQKQTSCHKQTEDIRKTIKTQRSDKKIHQLGSNSRTKLGKAKNQSISKEKDKNKKSLSTDKTKDKSKHNDIHKIRKIKIMEEYMTIKDDSTKKDRKNLKKNCKKSHNEYSRPKSKQKSKNKSKQESPPSKQPTNVKSFRHL